MVKTLIATIQDQLQAAAGLSYVDDDNITILVDENFIPSSWTFPAIGIKDGPIAEAGTKKRVHVIGYVEHVEGEVPIVGQASPAVKGILDLRADIIIVLFDNVLSITGIIAMEIPEEGESELVAGDRGMALIKKRITFEYTDVR